MAVASDQATSICSHCDRAIPTSNLDLHVAHCSRKLEKCKVCGDMIPKRHAEEHFLSTHAPVACSLCSETVGREILAVHKGENCPQRIVTCEYCEFPLPTIDLYKHQEVCGNRTELCHLCSRYIRLRERDVHESRCNGSANNIAESSRTKSELVMRVRRNCTELPEKSKGSESSRRKTDIKLYGNTIPAERDLGAPARRQPHDVSRKRLLFTIAITGIAVLFGSLIFQRKAEESPVH
ncbi:putative MADS-box transcription factor 27-like [Capsicum annuum]|nr:putative MADS-box transcription factor 27-like [Capsicum annuum]